MAFLLLCPLAYGFQEPEGLRAKFVSHIKAELDRLPDFVCTQTVERFSRASAENPWVRTDTLRVDVAFVGSEELYSLPGAQRFDKRPLADLAGRGTVSTGQLALLTRDVFLTSLSQWTYKGETEEKGRRAYEYTYDIPADASTYHLRAAAGESIVAFQGVFWIDAENLDLLRLEAQAYDIPPSLGLAEADTVLEYSRNGIDGVDLLLPLYASLTVVGANGDSSLNRTRLSGCEHYRSESKIAFHEPSETTMEADRGVPKRLDLPSGSVLEMTLDSALDPEAAKIGDTVRAILSRPLKDGERILVPQGTAVIGSLVRLEKTSRPFPIYEVGIQLNTLELEDGKIPLKATMEEAGPHPGLLKQSKHLDPMFTKQRTSRIDVLVREVQQGQGILEWDARHAKIPRGLKMKWRVCTSP